MAENTGWITLHRRILDWEWHAVPEMVSLWIHLLLMANHRDKKWMGIEVKRGQIITGRAALSEKTGLSERMVRSCLARLQKCECISIKTTSRFSIITVLNFDTYQNETDAKRPTIDQQSTNNRPTSDQQSTTNNNVNNVNNVNNLSPCARQENSFSEDPDFDRWFAGYKKPIGKTTARDRWSFLRDDDRQGCLAALPQYLAAYPDPRYRKNPTAYLEGRHWEDDLSAIVATGTTAQQNPQELITIRCNDCGREKTVEISAKNNNKNCPCGGMFFRRPEAS